MAGMGGLMANSPRAKRPASKDVAVLAGVEVDETRAQRLDRLTEKIRAAFYEADAKLKAARDNLVRDAGPLLAEIRDEELWRERGHASFSAFIDGEIGYGRQYVYQVIDSVPVVEALSATADTEITPTFAKVLAPIIKEHGPDAARQVWNSATNKYGRTTEGALRDAARSLNYLTSRAKEQADAIAAEARQAATADGVLDAQAVADSGWQQEPHTGAAFRMEDDTRQAIEAWAERAARELGCTPGGMMRVLVGALAESGGDVLLQQRLYARARRTLTV